MEKTLSQNFWALRKHISELPGGNAVLSSFEQQQNLNEFGFRRILENSGEKTSVFVNEAGGLALLDEVSGRVELNLALIGKEGKWSKARHNGLYKRVFNSRLGFPLNLWTIQLTHQEDWRQLCLIPIQKSHPLRFSNWTAEILTLLNYNFFKDFEAAISQKRVDSLSCGLNWPMLIKNQNLLPDEDVVNALVMFFNQINSGLSDNVGRLERTQKDLTRLMDYFMGESQEGWRNITPLCESLLKVHPLRILILMRTLVKRDRKTRDYLDDFYSREIDDVVLNLSEKSLTRIWKHAHSLNHFLMMESLIGNHSLEGLSWVISRLRPKLGNEVMNDSVFDFKVVHGHDYTTFFDDCSGGLILIDSHPKEDDVLSFLKSVPEVRQSSLSVSDLFIWNNFKECLSSTQTPSVAGIYKAMNSLDNEIMLKNSLCKELKSSPKPKPGGRF